MNRRTTLLLCLVVVVLGLAVWWQSGREERGDFDHVEPLFERVDLTRVHALRIDNLERSLHLKLEADARRRWSITDPIAYPADEESVRVLLEIVTNNPAFAVPPEERARAAAGFDPPRAVFEVSERLDDGGERVQRVELGEPDLDGDRVFVRVRGKVLRTWRNLDTMLQRSLEEMRSLRVFDMAPRAVVELRRQGFEQIGERPHDVGLSIRQHGWSWWMVEPWRVQLDPRMLTILAANAASLRAGRFVDDAPDAAALAGYRLDSPDFTLELTDRTDLRQRALFTYDPVAGHYLCKREDQPYVWGVEVDDVARILMPKEQLLDHVLLRAAREDVASVRIETGQGALRVVRADGRWTVAAKLAGEPEWSTPLPADEPAVERVLSTLTQVEIARYLFDVTPEEAFPEGAPLRGVWVEAGGEEQGGRVGARRVSDQGSQAWLYQRSGEELVALVPEAVAALLDLRLPDLQSLQLFSLDEVRLQTLELRQGERERSFQRSLGGTWRYPDMNAEAVELHPVLDALFFLRASEHLGPAGEPLGEPVSVAIRDVSGAWHRAVVGRDAEGRVVADVLGLRSLLADQDLHGRLLEIVARKPGPAGGQGADGD